MEKLAVLIDADNASAASAKEMFEEIAKYGVASVKRIYGDWSSNHLKGWQNILLAYALTPIQQFAYTKGKDATDMGLIIDAMDLLYSQTFDGFFIISSDSDFTPLASRIRAGGLSVYGIGEHKTPEAFRNACDRFIYLENLIASEPAQSSGAESVVEQSAPKKERMPIEGALKHLLYKAIKDSTDDGTGWAAVAHIGQYLSQTQSDFDPRSYGYAKLSSMLKALGGLQFRTDGTLMYCRKIPYGEFIKLLNEGIEKFKDKKGTTAVSALEKYLKPRFDWVDYGFERFEDFLGTVNAVSIEQDRVSIKQGNE